MTVAKHTFGKPVPAAVVKSESDDQLLVALAVNYQARKRKQVEQALSKRKPQKARRSVGQVVLSSARDELVAIQMFRHVCGHTLLCAGAHA